MKNTFAVTMTLLLALTLGGSLAGYRIATTPHHESEASAGAGAAGKAPTGGDPTTGKVVSEEAPSAREAATGAAGAPGALGDVMQDQAGGTQSGENGAVPVPGSESNTGAQTGPAQEGKPQDGGAQEAGSQAGGGSGTANGTNGQGAGQNAPANNVQDSAGAGNSGRGTNGTGTAAGDAPATNIPSPTADRSGQNTQLGQTGSSNVEKGMAADATVGKAKAAEVANAIEGNTAAGQAKFVSTCGGCHGQNGQGGIGPSLIAGEGPKSWKLEQFTAAVRQGHAPDRELGAVMPHFTQEQLSDEDLLNIYTYLRSVN